MPHAIFWTDFGLCGVAWTDAGLTRFQLPETTKGKTARSLASRDEGAAEVEPPPAIRRLIERVQRHFAGKPQDFSDAPLDCSGLSAFRRAIYRRAQAIPPGQTMSYGALAEAAGFGPSSARAVGLAMATNPWPLIVPCHRVVSADRKLTGFSAPGGVRTKARMLALEGAELLTE